MSEQLLEFLLSPYFLTILLVAVLIALCAALMGVTLVLKRYSLIGDGQSHVAFGAMSIAVVAGVTNDMLVVFPVTVVTAVLLLMGGQKRKAKGDSALAMVSVGALAIGYLLRSVFPSTASGGVSADVCGTLFGGLNILTLSKEKVTLCIVLSVVVVFAFVFFYHKIFAVTFDESFAAATGSNTTLYNLVIAVIIAMIVVLGMQLVGSLLISALVVFPAMSAMRVFKSFRGVTICSVLISVFCAFFGLLVNTVCSLQYVLQIPVGPTIVIANIAVFGVFTLAGFIRSR